MFMNAWSYHYLKRKILTITNTDDYKFLDALFIRSVDMEDFGNLYVSAISRTRASISGDDGDLKAAFAAAEEDSIRVSKIDIGAASLKRTQYVDPRIYVPAGLALGHVTLPQMMSFQGTVDDLKDKLTYSCFGEQRAFEVVSFDLERRSLQLKIYDSGLLGARPYTQRLEVRWKGSRSQVTGLRVINCKTDEYLLSDRIRQRQQMIDRKLALIHL